MEGDRAHLLRSPVKAQTMQQDFVVSNEAVEAEARANAMLDLQVKLIDLDWVSVVVALISERHCGYA